MTTSRSSETIILWQAHYSKSKKYGHEQQTNTMECQTNEKESPAQQEPQRTASSACELGREECDMRLTPYPLFPTRVEQEDHEFLVVNLGRQWTTGLLYRSTELLIREKE
jgi:hypothetical protein